MDGDPNNKEIGKFTIDASLQPLLDLANSSDFEEAEGLIILESAA